MELLFALPKKKYALFLFMHHKISFIFKERELVLWIS